MDTTELPSLTEKHNAMVSYCFLAPFMLLSRQEQFSSKFVRSHARYATLLHIGFIILIISLIRSRNFASVILYDMTWVHWVLFVLFFSLLFLLWNGLYSALKWNKPRISLTSLSLKSFEKEFSNEVEVSQDEKTSIILSHIPFLGTYLATKYGGKLSQGEKFSNWLTILGAVSVILDPSLTLLVTIIVMVIFWLVYQSIGKGNTSTIHLIGDRLWGGRDIHIFTTSVITYLRETFQHEHQMPSWTQIFETTKNIYQERKAPGYSALLYLPIINAVMLYRLYRNQDLRFYFLQGLLIALCSLYAILVGDTPLLIILCLAWFWGYTQARFQKDTNIPILGELSDIIIQFLAWKKKKSIPKEVQFTTPT